jgi:phosphoribosylanthranilate isomerase
MTDPIKIMLSGITSLSDARFAAAAGIDYIGFCFNHSIPQYIPPIKAKEITDWVSGCYLTGEFGLQSMEEIESIAEALHLDIIQAPISLLSSYTLSLPFIAEVDTYQMDFDSLLVLLNKYQNEAAAFLLRSSNQLSCTYDIKLMMELCSNHPIIWGYPVSEQELDRLSKLPLYSIDLPAEGEEKTGLADFTTIETFLEKLRMQ